MSSITDPLKRVRTYQYDKGNNLISWTNRRGQKATYGYDALNRRAAETYADATVSRSYDSSGRLVQVVDSQSGTFSNTYDLVGRLLKTVTPNGAISYTRDADGRVASRQVSGSAAVSYTYDPDGNLTNAAMGSTASVARTYDPRNLLLTNTRSNGVTGTYSFDAIGKLLAMSEKAGGSSTIFSRAFAYDAAGQLTANSVDEGLALATPTATGTFDAANEITAFGSTTYTNDADGHRLSEVGAAGTTAYTWDARGRLQAVSAPGGVSSAFVYDYAGNMIQEGVTSGGSTTTPAVRSRRRLEYCFDATRPERHHVHFWMVMDRTTLWRSSQEWSTEFPPAGSGIERCRSGRRIPGNVLGREFYEPFGAPTATGTVSLLQFTGRPLINTGLYYDRARFYDSAIGRFISEDPSGLAGGDGDLSPLCG